MDCRRRSREAMPAPRALHEHVRELADAPAAEPDPRGQPGERRACRQRVDDAAAPLDAGTRSRTQPLPEAIDARDELVLARHDDLGRVRRGRGADVRHEVGNRDVGLVPDTRDDGDRTGGESRARPPPR